MKHDLDVLLKHLLEFLMSGDRIDVSIPSMDSECATVVVVGTGLPLHIHTGPLGRCTLPVTIHELLNGTRFELAVPMQLVVDLAEKILIHNENTFYSDMGQRLRSYFKKTDNLVAALRVDRPKDAAFLEQVNKFIDENLGNPQFDANHLADAMNLSRAQLFRRLKPIIRRSTGNCIRMIRLQHAKELLETTDLRVNEVALKTGFETASNFTKIFAKQFGMNPSMIGKNQEELGKD